VNYLMNFEPEIKNIVKALTDGGTILYPTDTIWGIGCDATNAAAVERVFAIKKRGAEKSLIILLDDVSKLKSYVKQIPKEALALIETTEQPLTIIYPSADRKNLAENLLAPDGSIAIRITKDSFCKKMIEESGKPVVSTSANVSGENPPRNFGEIPEEIKKAVDYVVRYRRDEESNPRPSVIIRIGLKGEIEFIRK
jgi:L-threonylcarbamoyladenylate synthase